MAEGQKYLALGLKFAASIVFFMLAGLALDRWLGWTPILTLVGTVVGAVLSFLNIYWALIRDEPGSQR